uniref:Uncharacterized protein n=1 Tax=Oryza nivara TaxID=4536 RepID=A0A0E0HWJ2_ORYNI
MTPDDMIAATSFFFSNPPRYFANDMMIGGGRAALQLFLVPMDSNFGASRLTSLTGSAGDLPLGVLSDITNLSAAELRRKCARERYALLSVDEKEARNKKAREKRRQKKEKCQGGNQSGAAVKGNYKPTQLILGHLFY